MRSFGNGRIVNIALACDLDRMQLRQAWLGGLIVLAGATHCGGDDTTLSQANSSGAGGDATNNAAGSSTHTGSGTSGASGSTMSGGPGGQGTGGQETSGAGTGGTGNGGAGTGGKAGGGTAASGDRLHSTAEDPAMHRPQPGAPRA